MYIYIIIYVYIYVYILRYTYYIYIINCIYNLHYTQFIITNPTSPQWSRHCFHPAANRRSCTPSRTETRGSRRLSAAWLRPWATWVLRSCRAWGHGTGTVKSVKVGPTMANEIAKLVNNNSQNYGL